MMIFLLGVWLTHSWYPIACCNDRDCHPVKDAKLVEGGYQAEGVFYPNALVKPSPDADFHACFVPNSKKALCFFAPLSV